MDDKVTSEQLFGKHTCELLEDKPWRPDDWGEIVRKEFPDWDRDMEEARALNSFEAGADAMLEALRKRGRAVQGNITGVTILAREKGKVVFIPDDKEKK